MGKSKTPERRKRARKKKATENETVAPEGTSTVKASVRAGGKGMMQGLRNGFKRAAGGGDDSEKPSTLSNILWTVLLLGAVGVLLYRWYG